MHLGVVLARLSEHVHDVAARRKLAARPVIHDSCHLHSRTDLQFLPAVLSCDKQSVYCIEVTADRLDVACLVLRFCHRLALDIVSAVADLVRFCERDGDVIWHKTAFHKHPGLISHNMKDTYERFWRTVDDLDHLSLTALPVALLASHCHAHCVSVQGSSCL